MEDGTTVLYVYQRRTKKTTKNRKLSFSENPDHWD